MESSCHTEAARPAAADAQLRLALARAIEGAAAAGGLSRRLEPILHASDVELVDATRRLRRVGL